MIKTPLLSVVMCLTFALSSCTIFESFDIDRAVPTVRSGARAASYQAVSSDVEAAVWVAGAVRTLRTVAADKDASAVDLEPSERLQAALDDYFRTSVPDKAERELIEATLKDVLDAYARSAAPATWRPLLVAAADGLEHGAEIGLSAHEGEGGGK